eukprot:m.84500 g.84500  ORF g.84500 m.84500 type:complete len:132 (-) comp14391_c0_seq1:137-532(-)
MVVLLRPCCAVDHLGFVSATVQPATQPRSEHVVTNNSSKTRSKVQLTSPISLIIVIHSCTIWHDTVDKARIMSHIAVTESFVRCLLFFFFVSLFVVFPILQMYALVHVYMPTVCQSFRLCFISRNPKFQGL